jgi:murein DD-endopeptidase MepM/ murein hydrolase activator NlpD
LFAATDDADIPDAIAARIIEIFSSEIDFHKDLHKGDRFTVIYESHHDNGTQTGTGKVLAIEFVNQGRRHRAVYFQAGGSAGAYYTPEGKSLRKAFLRSPLEFSRISSGFSLARFHPVLNTWRAHRGVDYAAPTGTRIKAVADGRVAFSGQQGGYGNLIILQHQGKYSTAYGHLSGFARGMRKGQSVRQGDIIGYVGATGLATGPHLHYEFRVNGDQRDPLREVMPDTVPVSGRELVAFRKNSALLVTRLDMMQHTRLAFLD